MKMLVLTIASFLIAQTAISQQKVANYSSGKPGTKDYEHFSFWTTNGKRGEVSYSYGADRKEAQLTYLRKLTIDGKAAFQVQFPNKLILTVVPNGNSLMVKDAKGQYNKIFAWEYEGPVNGIGTFCEPCTEDEKEASRLLQSAYLK